MTDIRDLATPYTTLLDLAKCGSEQALPDLIEKLTDSVEQSNLSMDAQEVLGEILGRCVESKTIGKLLVKRESLTDFRVAYLVLKYHCWGYPVQSVSDYSAYVMAAKEHQRKTGKAYATDTVKKLWGEYNEWNEKPGSFRDFTDRNAALHHYKLTRTQIHGINISYFIAHCLEGMGDEDKAIRIASNYVHGEYGAKAVSLDRFVAAWRGYKDVAMQIEDGLPAYKRDSQLPDNMEFGMGIPEGFF